MIGRIYKSVGMITRNYVFYRGELKACNYSCNYCPFSKSASIKQIKLDKKALERFVSFVEQNNLKTNAIQFAPYGEALIHEYYWEAMARLTKVPFVERVGCQTNLSFSIDHMIGKYKEYFGVVKKLRLWCTFHPSMVSAEQFLEQCKKLEQHNILYSVGMVGNPDEIETLKALKKQLSAHIYTWVNKMDGLRRNYTKEEEICFSNIDPLFFLQLKHRKANPMQCAGGVGEAFFITGNGDVTACNISHKKIGNIYQTDIDFLEGSMVCNRKECDCFLAYCNRRDMKEMIFYGKYPMFRIAQFPKAVFLDVDGTLIDEETEKMKDSTIERIISCSKYSKIYLATSLPRIYAMKKCSKIKKVLSGGVFANGGNICFFDKREEYIIPITADVIQLIPAVKKKYFLDARVYKKEESIYKIVLKGRKVQGEKNQIIDEFCHCNCTFIVENEYLEITGYEANKLNGVIKICQMNGYKKEEVLVAGDSENDEAMLKYFPMSVRVNNKQGILGEELP